MTFNQEDVDTDSMVDLGTNADRITMTHQGAYRVAANPSWASPGVDSIFFAGIYTSDLSAIAHSRKSVNSGDIPRFCLSCWAPFTAGAIATFRVIQDTGGSLTLNAIEFSAHWVGFAEPSLPGVPA